MKSIEDFLSGEEQFTKAQMRAALGKSLSGSQLKQRLDGLVKCGMIKRRTKGTQEWFEVVRGVEGEDE